MIHITKINKKDLQVLKSGLTKAKHLPAVLENYLIVSGKDNEQIHIVNTDLENTIVITQRYSHDGPIRMTIPKDIFESIITIDDIKFGQIPDTDKVVVKGVATDFNMEYKEEAHSYPEVEIFANGAVFYTVPGLEEAMYKAVDFISKEPMRYVMNGISLVYKDDTLRVSSTNGKSLYVGYLTRGGMEEFDVVASWKTGARKALLKSTKHMSISTQDKHTGFHFPDRNITIWTKNKDGRYPPVDTVIPDIPEWEMFEVGSIDKATAGRIKKLPPFNDTTPMLKLEVNGDLTIYGFGGLSVKVSGKGGRHLRTTWAKDIFDKVFQHPIKKLGVRDIDKGAAKVVLDSNFDESIILMPVNDEPWIKEGVF